MLAYLVYQRKLCGARGGDLCLVWKLARFSRRPVYCVLSETAKVCKPSLRLRRSRAAVLTGTGERSPKFLLFFLVDGALAHVSRMRRVKNS